MNLIAMSLNNRQVAAPSVITQKPPEHHPGHVFAQPRPHTRPEAIASSQATRPTR
ncbi:hypothetical protein [Streptomyces sp. NPDC004520]|uniref:hypothetical protein n=1 Tax=unclassified Streptomyces TaxID=2593676 RepID=UPI0036835960